MLKKRSVWMKVGYAVIGVTCLITVGYWVAAISVQVEFSNIRAQANSDCQAVLFNMSAPDEAMYQLRNYDEIELSIDNLPDGADSVVTFRQNVVFGWVYGHISYKDGQPVSYLVGIVGGLAL